MEGKVWSQCGATGYGCVIKVTERGCDLGRLIGKLIFKNGLQEVATRDEEICLALTVILRES